MSAKKHKRSASRSPHRPAAPRDRRTKPPVQPRTDAWVNTVTQLGSSMDKRNHSYMLPDHFMFDAAGGELLDNLYLGSAVAHRIASRPAGDMVRAGFDITVTDSSDAADAVLSAAEDLRLQEQLREALVLARVHGGAVLYLGADDNQADPTEPLDEARLRRIRFLTPFDRWHAHVVRWDTDLQSAGYGSPLVYDLVKLDGSRTTVHASRVLRFDSPLGTARQRRRSSGWNISVYAPLYELIRDWDQAMASIAHCLTDFSVGLFKMRGLHDSLLSGPDDRHQASALVLERLGIMDMARSTARAVPLDAEAEDFAVSTRTFTDVPELLVQMQNRLAGAAEIPATYLWGRSPAGENSTGDADIRNYYDSIATMQQSLLRPQLERLLHLMFVARDGPTSGREPADWHLEFRSPWQLSDDEQAAVRKTQAEIDAIYVGAGILDPDEVRASRFGGSEYSTDTVLQDPSPIDFSPGSATADTPVAPHEPSQGSSNRQAPDRADGYPALTSVTAGPLERAGSTPDA
jgi:phage-related protein (TIGR01555 family)